MDKSFTFLAQLPSTKAALQFGETARVQLDVPHSEIANMVGLVALQNVVLKVTIQVAPDKDLEEATMREMREHYKRGNYVD
jgi:hypothetical protein